VCVAGVALPLSLVYFGRVHGHALASNDDREGQHVFRDRNRECVKREYQTVVSCNGWLMQTVWLSRVAVRALCILPFFRCRTAELIPSGERMDIGRFTFLDLNILMSDHNMIVIVHMCELGLRLLPMSVRCIHVEIEILREGLVEDMP